MKEYYKVRIGETEEKLSGAEKVFDYVRTRGAHLDSKFLVYALGNRMRKYLKECGDIEIKSSRNLDKYGNFETVGTVTLVKE